MARPREFDEADALRAAMRTFWSKGYEGTSITDLTEAMGVSRSTLYASFGDKESVFDRAVELYTEEISSQRYAILREAESARQGLRDFLQHHINVATGRRYPGGCLIVNSAAELDAVGGRVAQAIAARAQFAEDAIHALLERGKKSGEIAKSKDTRAAARMLIAVTYGIHVLARMKRDRKNLEEVIETAVSAAV